MRRILVGLILIILYGSLYPWHFVRWPLGRVLEWPRVLDGGDALVNILLYLPLGACAYWAMAGRGRLVRFIAPVILALLLSTAVEVTQAFEPLRRSSAYDIATNTIGGALGMLIASALPLRPSPELFLMAAWAAHLLFFTSWSWPVECLGWLIAASAVVPQRSVRWRGLLALGCYVALLARGLEPFRLAASAAPFNWVPFDAFLVANWEKMIPVIVAKLFWYGSAVWVLWRVKPSWMLAGVAAATFLALIEIAQRHIPPHVSEITDPLMALLLAAAFAQLAPPPREVPA